MTLRNPPTFLQAGQHPAENTRLALSGLLGSPQGVFAGGVITDSVATGDPGHGRVLPGDFQVTQNGTPNMTVNVAAGAAWIRGTESATQGSYHVLSDDTVNLTVDTADATNSRQDLVVVRVKDADYSGGDNEVVLEVVTGTAAGSPVDPAVPDNALVLARVTVGASASTITDGDITNFAITPVGLRFAGRVVFTAGETFTKADYPWLRAVNVKAVGGGGSGGGATATGAGQVSIGNGGNGGGYSESLLLASELGASETVTVGAGGAAVSASSADGGSSSFGSLVVAVGGLGGTVRTAIAPPAVFLSPDISSSGVGQITVPGTRGQTGVAATVGSHATGAGADSRFGTGGRGVAANQNGGAGVGFGSGGGGSSNGASSAARAGGAGAPGIVIVELYA